MLRNPIGFLRLGPVYLSRLFRQAVHIRPGDGFEAGRREFDPGRKIPYFNERGIYDIANTDLVQSPVRSYFEAAWRYYGLIPAISAMLLAASLHRRQKNVDVDARGVRARQRRVALRVFYGAGSALPDRVRLGEYRSRREDRMCRGPVFANRSEPAGHGRGRRVVGAAEIGGIALSEGAFPRAARPSPHVVVLLYRRICDCRGGVADRRRLGFGELSSLQRLCCISRPQALELRRRNCRRHCFMAWTRSITLCLHH